MVNLSLNELKQIAEMRCINGFRSMSRERLLSARDVSNESINNLKNFYADLEFLPEKIHSLN